MTREIGVQSWTYREFTLDGLLEELADTQVTSVELCHEHVTPEADAESVAAVADAIADGGLDVCGYGVAYLTQPGDVHGTLELVDRLGGEYASVDFPPDATAVHRELADAVAAYDLDVAVHNHGPGATYERVEDVLAVLEAFTDDRVGACVDTGHYRRSGQSPADVLPALGERVHAVHLKDFVDEDTEAVPGSGPLDVGELLALLDEHASFDRPLVVEYEADPDDPTPAVERAAAAVRSAE